MTPPVAATAASSSTLSDNATSMMRATPSGATARIAPAGSGWSSDTVWAAARAAAHTVSLDQPDPAGAIRAVAPDGVARIIEVALSDNVELDAAVAATGGVIAAYASRND